MRSSPVRVHPDELLPDVTKRIGRRGFVGEIAAEIVNALPRKMAARQNYALAHAKALESRDVEDMRAAVEAWDRYRELVGEDLPAEIIKQMRRNEW
jgi:predicted nucleotidyltransferase component of viral defense system